MTEQDQPQPQLFIIPAATLTRVVNFLYGLPFNQVAPLISMLDATVKEYKDDTSSRSVRKRNRNKSK